MPALATHYLAAKRTADLLAQTDLCLRPRIFYWGAQGPDFLYFHKPLNGQKSLRQVGKVLHQYDPDQLFTAMRDYAENCPLKDAPAVFSYCYGFLSHLALDSAAHPYVYYFQQVLAEQLGEKASFMHHKMEHNLDTIALLELENRPIAGFRVREALPSCCRELKAVSRMMAQVVNTLSGQELVEEKEIYGAFRDFKTYSGLLLSKRGRRRNMALWLEQKKKLGVSLSCFVSPLEPETDFDYVNRKHARWISRGLAGGRPSSVDFFALFDKAVEDGAYLAGRFRDCADHHQPLYFLKQFRFDNGETH